MTGGLTRSKLCAGESAGQPRRSLGCGEESPGSWGRVPGNAWGARAHGKCHRKYTAVVRDGKGEKVR